MACFWLGDLEKHPLCLFPDSPKMPSSGRAGVLSSLPGQAYSVLRVLGLSLVGTGVWGKKQKNALWN